MFLCQQQPPKTLEKLLKTKFFHVEKIKTFLLVTTISVRKVQVRTVYAVEKYGKRIDRPTG